MADIAALGITVTSDGAVKATSDLDRLKRAAGGAESGTKNLGSEATRTSGRLDSMAGSADRLASLLVRGFAVLTTGLLTRALANMADAWSDMQSVVGAAIKDMDAAPAMMMRIADIANASYSPLAQTAAIFSRNVGVLRELGYSADQAADFTEALNHALVVTATKGEQAASVQNALARAMAVGKLSGLGLETVIASAGRVSEALADHLGVTVNELRRLGAEGKITSQVIADSLIGSLSDLRTEAEEMPATIGDGLERIRTGLTVLVGVFDQALGASHSVAQAFVAVGDALKTMAGWDWTRIAEQGLRAVTIAAAALAGVLAGRMLATALAVGPAFWALTGATNALRGALALLGGPWGIAIGVVTALGAAFAMTSWKAEQVPDTLTRVADAQRDLNAAIEEYTRTNSMAALKDAEAAANRQKALVEEQLTALRARGASFLSMVGQSGMHGAAAAASDAASLREYQKTQNLIEASETRLQMIEQQRADIQQRIADIVAQTGVDVTKLTDDQLAQLQTALQMEQVLADRQRLAALENQYGRDSLQVMAENLRQERETYAAKLATLDVDERIRQRIMDQYDATIRAENAQKILEKAAEGVRAKIEDAHDWLVKLSQVEPGGGWLDTAISKAAALATKLWDAAAASLAFDSGSPLAPKTSPNPPAAPNDWGPPVGSRDVGGGGVAKVDEFTEAMKRLNTEYERNNILIAQGEMAVRIWEAQRDAGVEALSTQGQQIAGTVQQIALQEQQLSLLDQAKQKADEWRQTIEGAFVAFVTGAQTFHQALGNILMKLAQMAASKAFEVIWSGKDGSGGIGGFISKLLGFADGTSFAPGGLAMVGERGPELVRLPQGARVYNAQASRDMARQGQAGGNGGHISIGFDKSTGDLTATMTDIAGGVVQRARSGIVSDAVRSSVTLSQRTKAAFG